MRRSSTCKKHPCSAAHEQLVENYRLAVEAQERRCEAAALGYATETAEFYAQEPRLTFKEWLWQNRGSGYVDQ